jgi:hypothetical protein
VASFIIAYPVLWILGLAVPGGALLLGCLAVVSGIRTVVTAAVAIPWYLVTVAQALAVCIHWSARDLPVATLARRLLSPGVLGWAMFGIALAVGREHLRSPERIRTAGAVLGGYILFGAVVSGLLFAIGVPELSFDTPLAGVVPAGLDAREMYFTAHVFMTDPAIPWLPRLRLLFPWAVMLGYCSLAVVLLSADHPSARWRWIGMVGGGFGVVGSQSRVVILCFAILLPLLALRRIRRDPVGIRPLILVALIGLVGVSGGGLILQSYGGTDLGDVYAAAMEWRGGSTDARMLGYIASWEGFLESPLWGHGWPGEYVHPEIPQRVGSHSSVFGLLYTGGAVSLGLFLLALGSLMARVLWQLLIAGTISHVALGIAVTLPLLSVFEGLYSYGPTLFPFLIYVGGSLAHRHAAESGLRPLPLTEQGSKLTDRGVYQDVDIPATARSRADATGSSL